jgi:hypothetical protein
MGNLGVLGPSHPRPRVLDNPGAQLNLFPGGTDVGGPKVRATRSGVTAVASHGLL